eukprot:CAMPEP_0202857232 /NCGR_PEP_ID=MMETSP1391-20130828/255_1 /ASSEMBLY_ACC=CAM_ASM_000867 /TAXON_ID=1034604 /ORGANISM="Chlamydomonas leiostraca, Strain SAG 11-49" /LENGTH=185 /DNA_ID=CAMNT_0049536011 /DNA_START=56 /DNA_END=613 /DNA_ORIENTATION=-
MHAPDCVPPPILTCDQGPFSPKASSTPSGPHQQAGITCQTQPAAKQLGTVTRLLSGCLPRPPPPHFLAAAAAAAAAAASASAFMRSMNSALRSYAARFSSPSIITTSMPAAVSVAMPSDATSGLGSPTPTTTRDTPASTSARLQGGVRPWWLHGSSVTYAVAPLASLPAPRSAYTSACGMPALGW